MTKIKINVKKQVSKDGRKYVSLGISGLKDYRDLPTEYTALGPAVERTTTGVLVLLDGQDNRDNSAGICAGDVAGYRVLTDDMTEEDAEKLIALIQRAGERLHKINQRIARERALYAGESEILI